MINKLALFIFVTATSTLTMAAPDQGHCKDQAIAAVDTVKWVANTFIGQSDEQMKQAKDRMTVLEGLLQEERYCEALTKATNMD
ncbi:hypothetical protein A1QO_02690 [Vibrio genomosp. F10 str. ZF-129]|uniref:Uncharacterized protein n=1 Tax=Vibrio genomosp. F10 str. ZF-129 TaxID=1187848 RepID=A0A1E5BKM1_9VIBR|nr:hypothetical protein [Vibrio genomosp. F10]OEE38305.1 hypothetical protein A1QO_02690 [Vibrio genomosp. F10 str. ZF-129]